jgi:carboxyl-terminal processing protease
MCITKPSQMPRSNDIQFFRNTYPCKLCRPTTGKVGPTQRIISPSLTFRIVLSAIFVLSFFCRSSLAVSPQSLSLISEIRNIISQKALYPPSEESLAQLNMDRLADGLHSIDSHARYIPSSPSSQKSSSSLRIGLDVFEHQSRIWVIPEPGGPASQIGIPEVSELRGVNNVRITNSLESASAKIDAAIKQKFVILDVYDWNDGKDKKYTLKPATYTSSPVTTKTIGNCVFIRISDFVSHETAPFFSGLYTTIDKSKNSIIIDLRGCPGGDLFEALEIAGMFVPAGLPLITTYDRAGKVHAYISPAGLKLSPPTCIVVDNRTASAAEILAGILKNTSITRLVGERSYGKCESQTIFPLSNGGELWLTTLAIRFPDGTSCTESGVQPDVLYPDISVARLANIKNILLKHDPL